jgi:hypothetical protein
VPSKLKLVILYDARRNSYTVCDHNLTPSVAEKQVAEWRRKSLFALVVNQRAPHEIPDPQECQACRTAVEDTSGLKPKPQFERMVMDMTPQKQKTPPPPPEATSGRKPWKKKTPVEVVLAQIERVREDVGRREEDLKAARRELQKLEEAQRLLESK